MLRLIEQTRLGRVVGVGSLLAAMTFSGAGVAHAQTPSAAVTGYAFADCTTPDVDYQIAASQGGTTMRGTVTVQLTKNSMPVSGFAAISEAAELPYQVAVPADVDYDQMSWSFTADGATTPTTGQIPYAPEKCGQLQQQLSASASQGLKPLNPARLLDTRFETTSGLAANSTYTLKVANHLEVPAKVSAVAINVTAVNPAANGYLTVYPCDQPRPLTSQLNYTPKTSKAATILAAVSAAGEMCIYTLAKTNVVVDVNGYVPMGGNPVAINPVRVADSRPGMSTVDGINLTPVTTTQQSLAIGGRAGIPTDIAGVFLNVVAANAEAAGFVTISGCSETARSTSTVNFKPGPAVSNSVFVQVTGDYNRSTICASSSVPVGVVIDVTGYATNGGAVTGVPSQRLLDTRTGTALNANGQPVAVTAIPAGARYKLHIPAQGNVTTPVTSALVNITAVRPSADGFITAFPCDQSVPLSSNLNYKKGEVVANGATIKADSTGDICFYSSAATHLIVDLTGVTASGVVVQSYECDTVLQNGSVKVLSGVGKGRIVVTGGVGPYTLTAVNYPTGVQLEYRDGSLGLASSAMPGKFLGGKARVSDSTGRSTEIMLTVINLPGVPSAAGSSSC